MTAAIFNLSASKREDMGKGASRRLRRLNNQVPAIIYGGSKAPQPITLNHNELLKAISHEAFYSHILTLDVDGQSEQVVLKDLQRVHAKRGIMHMDFQRVSGKDKISMRVPLHFINEENCPGAKAGGIITHLIIDLEIRCPANKLPEFIEIDMANLELDQSIHLSDITLPEGVEIPALGQGKSDLPIVSVHAAKGSKSDDAEKSADAEGKKEEE